MAPDFLDAYVAAAEPYLPAVVSPQVITYDHPGASTFRFPTWRHVLAQRTAVIGHRRHLRWVSDLIGEDKPRDPDGVFRPDWVAGTAILLRTEDFRAVGGFDERFHMYLEEVDLQKRLAERSPSGVCRKRDGRARRIRLLRSGTARPVARGVVPVVRRQVGWRRRLWIAMGSRQRSRSSRRRCAECWDVTRRRWRTGRDAVH